MLYTVLGKAAKQPFLLVVILTLYASTQHIVQHMASFNIDLDFSVSESISMLSANSLIAVVHGSVRIGHLVKIKAYHREAELISSVYSAVTG